MYCDVVVVLNVLVFSEAWKPDYRNLLKTSDPKTCWRTFEEQLLKLTQAD